MEAELSRANHFRRTISPTLVSPSNISRTLSVPSRGVENQLDLAIATMSRLEIFPDFSMFTGTVIAKGWMEDIENREPREWLMSEGVKIFSDIFFLDNVRYPVTVLWEENIGQGEDVVYGESTHLNSGMIGDDHMRIRIDLRPSHEEKGLPDAQSAYLSTFSNQMIHAYLQSHCCAGTHEHANLSNSQVCRRGGDEEGPLGWYIEHVKAWFFLACRIELCLPGRIGFEGNFLTFHALVKNFRVHGMRLTAGDWKLFFEHFEWEEVCKLLGRLDMEDFLELVGFLCEDQLVMQIFADEGLKQSNRPV